MAAATDSSLPLWRRPRRATSRLPGVVLGILAIVAAGGLAAVPPAAVAVVKQQTAQDMLTDANTAIACRGVREEGSE